MEKSTHRMAFGAGALVALLLALVTLALPPAAYAAYAPWSPQTSGTTQPLYGVAFANDTAGWAAGGGGVILCTTDGGTTWKAQASKTTQTLNAILFTGTSSGWAVGGGGVILHTTNGGSTWAAQVSGTTQSLNALAFANATTGWAVGSRGAIVRTTNGGATWTPVQSGVTQSLYGVACADASSLWVVGNKGTIRHSTDGGSTWAGQYAGTKTTLNAVGCSSATTAWIVGNGGFARKTTNGGAAWVAQSSGTRQTLRAVAVIDASRVRIAGSYGTVSATVNGGSTWAAEATGTTQSLYDIAWSGTHGWAVGGGGTIIAYKPDTSAPTTTATGLQADDDSGWTNAAVTVTLSATDAGTAGVSVTNYTVDGGAQKTYAAPFPVSAQGHHTVVYWSVDGAGNAEAKKTGYVNIDTTPPTVSSDADPAWHTTDVTVILHSDDTGGSGVAMTQYRATGAPDWTTAVGDQFVVATADGQGPHAFDIRSVDAAGNASVTGACLRRVDATPPVTTPTGLGADKLSGWTSTTRTVTLSASDGAGSGVASIHYTVDGGSEQTYTGSFTVSGNGQHPVTYWSVDQIGNSEETHTGWVNISDPYAQADGLAAGVDSDWHNSAVTVTITASGAPGPLTVCYQLDDGTLQEVSSPASFDVAGAAHHTVLFYAKNGNGVEGPHETGYVNIDTAAPQTTTQVGAPKGWVNHAVKFVFLTNDDSSGVTATYSALDDGTAVEGTVREVPAPADHSGDGVHTVTYWSADAAGNVEPAVPATVRIDTRRPTTKAPYSAAVIRGRTVKLRFAVADRAPCAGTATAKIVIRNSHGRTVKTLRLAKVRTGLTTTLKYRCKLAKGKYRFFVYATDAAGNTQSRITSNRLTVR